VKLGGFSAPTRDVGRFGVGPGRYFGGRAWYLRMLWLRLQPVMHTGCVHFVGVDIAGVTGSIPVAPPPLREAYPRSGLRSRSNAFDRRSLKKA
jgi:hypothetical protein